MHNSGQQRLAIVGSGFSGVMVAVHLLRAAPGPLTIVLLERRPQQFARGVAYSATELCHRLNVPAANMSAFPDQPDHLLQWVAAQPDKFAVPIDPSPSAFLPRRVYGEYIRDVLREAERHAAKGVVLEPRVAEVQALRAAGDATVELELADGEILRVDYAVLALGNFRAGNPRVRTPAFYQSDHYIDNPWEPEAFARVPKNARCLFVGSGLTMVDWVNALSLNDHAGVIHIISRHGLAPLGHWLERPAVSLPEALRTTQSVRTGLREFRKLVRASGDNWRGCLDAFRPLTQELWGRLPAAEQRRFLAHLRPYWDQHRHRLAPEVASCLHQAIASGMVKQHVGRVVEYHLTGAGVEAWIEPRGSGAAYAIQVDWVINCCGAESDYRKLEQPLVRSLFRDRLASVDDLGLGLKVDGHGALIDAAGHVSKQLFTLGPPQKGTLWETTAVPEIRVQAQRLAARLLHSMSGLAE